MEYFSESDRKASENAPTIPGLDTLRPSLVRRIKAGRKITQDDPPSVFQTPGEWMRWPRHAQPPMPTADMVSEIRSGKLSRFFPFGRIIRGADWREIVDPQIARISLDETYEYDSCHLSIQRDAVPGIAKKLSNLFYTAINGDELPSYHFWLSPGDRDPIDPQRVVSYGDSLDNSPPEQVDPTSTETDTEQSDNNARESDIDRLFSESLDSSDIIDTVNDHGQDRDSRGLQKNSDPPKSSSNLEGLTEQETSLEDLKQPRMNTSARSLREVASLGQPRLGSKSEQ